LGWGNLPRWFIEALASYVTGLRTISGLIPIGWKMILIAKCLADAAKAGLSRVDIEEETGSIQERILEAMSDAAEDELHRRPEKDN
jgi:hypothetical protein